MTPNRKFRILETDSDGICVEERCRYAPRKFDCQRVFITWAEVEKMVKAKTVEDAKGRK